jgi:hypothetical protein
MEKHDFTYSHPHQQCPLTAKFKCNFILHPIRQNTISLLDAAKTMQFYLSELSSHQTWKPFW